MTPRAVRWLKFNFVGAIGIVVQMAAFALLFRGVHLRFLTFSGLGLNYLAATGFAVEIAVLHNFVWHELYTWKHLPNRAFRDIALRLLRFHLGNGAVSILGNLILMRIFAGALRVPHYLASLISIALCSLLNFAASEWFVFRN